MDVQKSRSVRAWTRGMAVVAAAVGLFTAAPVLAASSATDCPAAWTPYSSRTALIDLMLDPRAQAVLDRQGLPKMPARFASTTPPTFAAILSPGLLMGSSEGGLGAGTKDPKAVAALDKALAAIPITKEAAEWRCARYDTVPPTLAAPTHHPAILVFEKINGFRDGPSVTAAHKAFVDMAARRGWTIDFTENGAVFNARQLKGYDVVVWNNVSGDVLTLKQEKAFQDYLAAGGGFAGVHGTGGDPVYFWDWYPDTLLAARFIGHPMNPQFQAAKVVVEAPGAGVTAGMPENWTMTEEWYSFAASPRLKGVHVVARLDESTYNPEARLRMGDHPIAWTHCLGNGRVFYTAIGHRPESYTEPNSLRLLEQGVAWAAGGGDTRCKAGREIARH